MRRARTERIVVGVAAAIIATGIALPLVLLSPLGDERSLRPAKPEPSTTTTGSDGHCPRDYGPWADPDCPEQAWVRALVEEARYQVTGDTGSAVVATGEGVGFYMWTTPARSTGDTEGWAATVRHFPPPVTVDGTRLYISDTMSVWASQGFRLWVSPHFVDPVPRSVLEELVRSSNAVDYGSIDVP